MKRDHLVMMKENHLLFEYCYSSASTAFFITQFLIILINFIKDYFHFNLSLGAVVKLPVVGITSAVSTV